MLQDARHPAFGLLRRALRAASLPFAWPAAALRRSRASTFTRAQSAECAKFDHRNWTAALLKHLEWRRFEEFCAAYLRAAGADNGSTLMHCKAWDAYRIGVKALRELREAMRAAGVREGIFITSGRFTREAVTFAAAENIRLVDGAALLGKLAELPPPTTLELLKLATRGDFLTPTCPVCAVKMASRKSIQGGRSFWGCPNYPACKETLSATAPA